MRQKLIAAIAAVSLIAIASLAIASSSFAQTSECSVIKDSLERLRCYDTAANGAPSTTDDPIIQKAKAAVQKLLREPESARFENLKHKAVNGTDGVCGRVSSRNGVGGRTGPKLFVYDGESAHVLVSASDGAAENGTKFNNLLLGALLGDTLKGYERFCKEPSKPAPAPKKTAPTVPKR